MDTTKTDVLIVGCGPTGVTLAHFLGQLGISVIILEKDEKVFPVPRATHLDEETLRNFQATGLIKEMEQFTSPFGIMEVRDIKGRTLFREEVIQPGQHHGYTGSRFFDQPAFEKILRRGLQKYSTIKLLSGTEVTSVSQAAGEVMVTAKGNDGSHSFIASWLIGCDGGRSVVRTSLGIQMDALEPARDWVIVDTVLKDEASAAFLPSRFHYSFHPERLTIYAHGFGKHRRWEFQMVKNEKMPEEDTIKQWISPYISTEKLEITRIAKYAHNSLVARTWKNGRVILAGDAAHMMPPSAGQGLCSGIRDAINLGWKLAAVINKQAQETLLDTYETERKPHLDKILKRALFLGHRMDGDTPLQRWWRKLSIQGIEQVKPLKNYLRKTYNTPPVLTDGFLYSASALAGTHLPQYISSDGSRSDDATGYRFILVSLPETLSANAVAAAKAHSIQIAAEQDDSGKPGLHSWLNKNSVDFVIVRPDKIIFGGGKKDEFFKVLAAFDQSVRHTVKLKQELV